MARRNIRTIYTMSRHGPTEIRIIISVEQLESLSSTVAIGTLGFKGHHAQ